MVAAAVVSIGAAAAVVEASDRMVIGVLGAGLLVGLLAVSRQWLQRARTRLDARSKPGETEPADNRFGLARGVFCAGLLTMTWLQWRVGVTVSDLLFLLAVLIAAPQLIAERDSFVPRVPLLLVGVWTFAIGALVATLASDGSAVQGIAVLARVVYLLVVWYFLAGTVIRTPQHAITAVGWWVAGVAVCGAWATAQTIGLIPDGVTSAGRAVGLTDHENDLGAACAIALLPALAVFVITRKLWWLGALALVLAGLVFSGSVSAAAAAIGAVVVGLMSRQMIRPVIALTVACIAVLAFTAGREELRASPVERLETITSADEDRNTVASRKAVYATAWAEIREHPFIGKGLDDESAGIGLTRKYAVHNLFLGRWYETGLLGLIGILLVVAWMLRAGLQTVIDASARVQPVAFGLLGAAVAFVVIAMSQPLLYKRFALVPGALILALVAVHQRRLLRG